MNALTPSPRFFHAGFASTRPRPSGGHCARRFSVGLLTIAAILIPLSIPAQSLTSYVDPRIGTGDHGHVFVGANVPFGMVDAGPTQLETGWDWCSGYHESGTKIVGFAQTHLSGTGCSDLGDVALMPAVTPLEPTRQGLATPYSHDDEEVRPGYYSVLLPESGIRTEVTATCRTALYRFTYPDNADRHLYVDLENGVGDRVRWGRLTQLDPYTFVGFRVSHGWAYQQHCYFVMRLNQKARICQQPVAAGTPDDHPAPVYHLQTENADGTPLLVRIALSPVSEANAIANLNAEAGEGDAAWNFDAVRNAADAAWNRELSRIQATFLNDSDRRIFYTAMYHFMVAPQVWDDVNGDWRGADNRVYRRPTPFPNGRGQGEGLYLTTLSLWDTYRAAAPLSTIILPEMMPSVVETYLRIFREQGKLPVWHLMSQETNCMVGCPAVPILADALLKGYVRDTTLALQAMTSSLLMDERGLDDMKRLGYVSNEYHGGSLSMSLEYMLADWSVAQALHQATDEQRDEVASYLTDKFGQQEASLSSLTGDEVGLYFDRRSRGYVNLYDDRVGFFRGKNAEGAFDSIQGFNPAYQTREFTEGNPWQYLWLVPHDIEGLMQLLGGRKQALQRLDALFAADSQLNADANPDITGLIGQYAHGNEPSHHTAYLYALMGQPRKTADIVHRIQRELYTTQPAGLCGNEDVGQMSAWYILSALGFYQVEPCGGRYVIGAPLVKEATLHVGQGRTFTVRTHGLTERAYHVRQALLNGQPLAPTDGTLFLRHDDIVNGGTLDLYMSK